MTRHKSPEMRINEILDAAAGYILENHYSTLTMDAIIARSSLSKGGVYRFFSNKREVALALFERTFTRLADIDSNEVMGWNLPLKESLLRLIFHDHVDDVELHNSFLIWLQIFTEVTSDIEFRKIKDKHMATGNRNIANIVQKIMKRDALRFTPKGQKHLKHVIAVSEILVKGLIVETLGGTPRKELERLIKWYLEDIITEGVEMAAKA